MFEICGSPKKYNLGFAKQVVVCHVTRSSKNCYIWLSDAVSYNKSRKLGVHGKRAVRHVSVQTANIMVQRSYVTYLS